LGQCRNQNTRDIRSAYQRIYLLEGKSNPAYIAFMTGTEKDYDPVENCFQLSLQIKQVK